MRSEKEMMNLFMAMAKDDERIRVLTIEGSRTNPNVEKDIYQDYDISFLVKDMASFLKNDEWLSVFGDLLFMQKPDAMELFDVNERGWFSYLMLFSDGQKIDLSLIPIEDADFYFQADPLIEVLLDKDDLAPPLSPASDENFWIAKPPEAFIKDSSNEFSFVSTYIARAILRKELLFANQLFDAILRKELLRMLRYLAGARSSFPFNPGKRDRYLHQYLHEEEWNLLTRTYDLQNLASCEKALAAAFTLFQVAVDETCQRLDYAPVQDVEKVKEYIEVLKSYALTF